MVMLSYLLEVTICWAVFYLLYYVLLRRETFFRFNRHYLLGSALLGLLIPAVEMNGWFATDLQPLIFQLPTIIVGTEVPKPAGQENFDFWTTLRWIYGLGIAVALARFSYGLLQIFRLFSSGEILPGNGYRFISTNGQRHAPFSFFNCLFWSKTFDVGEDDRRSILRHEEAHIFQRHSFDVLFFELLGIIFWCSPPLYFYKKALKTTHEYLADAHVLRGADKKQYGRLLLRQSQFEMQVAISNSLFHSQLKQRIVMMTQPKSPQRASLKYLAALPLLALLCLNFSFGKKSPVAKNSLSAHASALVSDTIPGSGEEIFKEVEEVPRFPGCENFTDAAERKKCAETAMLKFIFSSIKYPAEARKNGIEGIVVVSFVVEKNGSLTDAKIVKSIGGGCDEEVLRLVSLMPKWIPGVERGKPVRTQFNLPVKFKLG